MKVLIITFTVFLFLACGGSTTPSSGRDYPYKQGGGEYIAKEVRTPSCDASDSRVAFIQTMADWQKIDDSSKTVFCVKPGDYRNSVVEIKNSSGTKENPRYIILDNGNNNHPAKLNSSQLSSVDLRFENSNYWILDRMASIGSTGIEDAPIVFIESSHNIVNRHFIDRSSGGISIRDRSNNNTIQNSRIQNMSETGLKGDRSCILLVTRDKISEVKNTQILYNELHNCNDGIHALWRDGMDVNYEGTVIYGNDISVDTKLYTDCHGVKTPNGECSYSENAIDLKAGSKNDKNPIVVKANHVWGFRKSDKTNSSLGDPGVAIVTHYGVQNIVINENTVFDSVLGIYSVDSSSAIFALSHAQISGNYLFGISDYPLVINEANSVLISKNYIVNSLKHEWLVLDTSNNLSVTDNKIINSVHSIEQINTSNITEHNNLVYSGIEDTNLSDKSFTTDKFSNSPKVINPLLY